MERSAEQAAEVGQNQHDRSSQKYKRRLPEFLVFEHGSTLCCFRRCRPLWGGFERAASDSTGAVGPLSPKHEVVELGRLPEVVAFRSGKFRTAEWRMSVALPAACCGPPPTSNPSEAPA